MRVAKSEIIAGLPAAVARDLVRLSRGSTFAQDVADSLLRKCGIEDGEGAFAGLEQAGYLEKVRSTTTATSGGKRPSSAMRWRWQALES